MTENKRNDQPPTEKSAEYDGVLNHEQRFVLRLFVTGMTSRSTQAINNIQKICEEELQGRYQLEVVDLVKQPELAKTENIIAAPTLIKNLPLPLRRLIGDLSDKERVLRGLDLSTHPEVDRE